MAKKPPPKSGQFKPGQSGNPKGRPKGTARADLLKELNKILLTKKRTAIDGVRKTEEMQYWLMMKLVSDALKGKAYAQKIIMEQLHGYPKAKHEIEGSLSLMDELFEKAQKHAGEKYADGKGTKKPK